MISIYVFQPCTRGKDGECLSAQAGANHTRAAAGPWVVGATCVHVASHSQCMLRLTADLLPNTIFSFINRLKKSHSCLFPDRASGEFIGAVCVFLHYECAVLLWWFTTWLCGHHRRSHHAERFLRGKQPWLLLWPRDLPWTWGSGSRWTGCTPWSVQSPGWGSLPLSIPELKWSISPCWKKFRSSGKPSRRVKINM